MKRSRWIVFALFFTLGCASSSRTRGVGNSLLSNNNEAKLGAELSKKVESEMGLVDDPALLAYVQAVGARVAKESPRQDVTYTFQIVNAPEPNAFALPGGYLYVSRGILALLNTEDELAGVLGHEIAHVSAKHASQTLTRAVIMSPVTIATSIAGSLTGIIAPRVGDLIEGVGETTTGLVLSPHSRTQEREADRLGQEMVARAGYDPAGLTRALDALQREEALDNPSGSPPNSFLATHPATSERVEQTGERAKELKVVRRPGIEPDRAAFLNKLQGLLIGEDVRKGVFIQSRYIDPEESIVMDFPAGRKLARKKGVVVAEPETGDALLILQKAGPSADHERLMQQRLKKFRADRAPIQSIVNGLRIWEVEGTMSSSSGRLRVHNAWIDHQNSIYEMTGAAAPDQFNDYSANFSQTIKSFRPLQNADLSAVREARLTVIQVKAVQKLGAWNLQNRYTAWSVEQAAVYNALQPDSLLQPGQQLKLAIWMALGG